LAIQWAGRVMRDGGRIVNVSSLNTQVPAPTLALYCASKAAMEQFAKVAARELGGRGITANTVSSGATDTDMLRGANPPEALELIPAYTALGRLGRPDDIAAVVALLARPDARWVTGQNVLATGGLFV
ncbi:SDR family oxidoreductase, partial [Nonomuraea insulae]